MEGTPSLSTCTSLQRGPAGTPWVARIPSCSNLSDAPSRFVPGELTRWLGAFCVSPLVPSLSASGRRVVPGLFDPLAEPATNVLSGDSVFQTSQ
jgi:hypothetical protein